MILYHDQQGRITRCVRAPDTEAEFGQMPNEAGFVISDTATTADESYVLDGELVAIPPQPSTWHQWDWSAHAWVPIPGAAAQVKQMRCAAVDAERERRGYLPIVADGATWDADELAQRNITGKALDIASGTDIPETERLWRDAENTNHACATTADLQALLTTLWRAISQRGSALYAAGWTLKAQINALPDDDIAAIQTFDITQGWPT
jgi:hypothetical protein